MNLYFEHSDGRRSLVSADATLDTVSTLIDADVHMRNPNYRIPYTRVLMEDGFVKFDVGSHTEFYLLQVEEDDDVPVYLRH